MDAVGGPADRAAAMNTTPSGGVTAGCPPPGNMRSILGPDTACRCGAWRRSEPQPEVVVTELIDGSDSA